MYIYIYDICIYIYILAIYSSNSLGSFDDPYVASKTDLHSVASRI